MKLYEYEIIPETNIEEEKQLFAELGLAGFELVQIHNNHYYFKRPNTVNEIEMKQFIAHKGLIEEFTNQGSEDLET
jgi:hypothetical protein